MTNDALALLGRRVDPLGQSRLATRSRVGMKRALGSDLIDLAAEHTKLFLRGVNLAIMKRVQKPSRLTLEDGLAGPVALTVSFVLLDALLR